MVKDTVGRFEAWLLAVRPKTLPAAVAPVLVGSALAFAERSFAPLPALAALTGALLLQVGVNLANDYFDFRRGIDGVGRLGPLRVTQTGLISPAEVRAGIVLVFTSAALVGLYLVAVGGWPILAVGSLSILAALAYSGGPWPLASHGLGDLFVFIFFGPVAVCGTFYVQAHHLSAAAASAAVPPGLLITAILVVNNLRDIETDARAGKYTLAVRLGPRGTLAEFLLLITGAYFAVVFVWRAGLSGASVLLTALSLPLVPPLVRTLRDRFRDGPAMNTALAGTARLALFFCALFAAGIMLG